VPELDFVFRSFVKFKALGVVFNVDMSTE